jgi:hypothetical protein
MITSKRITQDQVFSVVAKALNVCQGRIGGREDEYSVKAIKGCKALRQEILSDFSIMGEVPVLYGCKVRMKAQGCVRLWEIEGDLFDIESNLQ